jgi:hypothetical protein
MHVVFASLPLLAAALAVPQFLPQLARVRRAGTTAGVSWSWAALTSVNNAAWLAYFALSGFWTALVPAVSATVLSGLLAAVLARRGAGVPKRPLAAALAWAVVLVAAAAVSGRAGLGLALAVAFIFQVTPSVWTIYRSADISGVSRGTWLLIFGELLCWGTFGIHEADPRLIVLGATGVAASLLVLARVTGTSRLGWARGAPPGPRKGLSPPIDGNAQCYRADPPFDRRRGPAGLTKGGCDGDRRAPPGSRSRSAPHSGPGAATGRAPGRPGRTGKGGPVAPGPAAAR